MKLAYFLIFFLFKLFLSHKLEVHNKSNGYFCGGKILDAFFQIPKDQIYYICSLLKEDENFLLSIKSSLNIIGITEKIKEIHEKDSEKIFEENCVNFDTMCRNGFLISIYTSDREIVIYPGDIVRKKIPNGDINLVKLNIIKLVTNKNYLEAMKTALTLLRNFMFKGKVDRKEIKFTEDLIKIDENLYIVIKIIFMIVVVAIVILIAGILLPNSIITSKPNLFNYTGFMINIKEEINKSVNKEVSLTECLICTKSLTDEDKDQSISTELIGFNCGHVFHKLCQEVINKIHCLACLEEEASQVISSSSSYRLNENQLHNLVKNLGNLYTKKEINEFYENYSENAEMFSKIFKVGKEDLVEEENAEEMRTSEEEEIKRKKIN
jgi:hypothetical protein